MFKILGVNPVCVKQSVDHIAVGQMNKDFKRFYMIEKKAKSSKKATKTYSQNKL